MRRAKTLDGAAATPGSSLRGVPGVEHWDAQFGASGVTNIVCWDGSAWAPLLLGVGAYRWIMDTGFNKAIVAMAVLGPTVFAAGTLTTAGGIPAYQIAKWEGANWPGVRGGVVGSGTVLALTAMGNDLHAGGAFTNMLRPTQVSSKTRGVVQASWGF